MSILFDYVCIEKEAYLVIHNCFKTDNFATIKTEQFGGNKVWIISADHLTVLSEKKNAVSLKNDKLVNNR